MPDLFVEVAELLVSPAEVRWPEALALVQSLANGASQASSAADLVHFRLLSNGKLVAPHAEPAEVAQETTSSLELVSGLADVLRRVLPPPSAPTEPKVPAALRYSVIRALGGITAPRFASVEEFSEALARFERGNRAVLLTRLFDRWTAARARASWPPSGNRSLSGAAPTSRFASREAGASPRAAKAWDTWPLAAAVPAAPGDPAGEVSLWRNRPDLETRPRGASSDPPPRRRPAGPLLTSLVALSILLASVVVTAAFVLTADGTRRSPWMDVVQPGVAFVQGVVAGLHEKHDTTGTPGRDARPTEPKETAGTAGETGTTAADGATGARAEGEGRQQQP